MANLTLKGIRKSFNGSTILHGIDLDIADGEFVVFVGPSGCGKSTLLRSICGLEEIDSGEIVLAGRRVDQVAPAERSMAMVFQSYALYPHMTVFENMAFALKLAGSPRTDIEAKVNQVAQTLQIVPLLQRRPKELSGGQRQRVAIGRAIVRQPALFLFDEPLSNLDAALRVQMRIELASLHRALKTTMIYVTHDQVEAMTLAHRIVVLNGGRIEQVGAPLDLYHRPVNRFVAGFLGSPNINFFSGELAGVESGRAVVRLPNGCTLQTDSVPAEGAAAGSPVTVGIRPECLTIASGECIGASVTAIERLGDTSYVHAALDGSGEALTVRAEGDCPLNAGAKVALQVRPEHVHVFGPDDRRWLQRGEVASAH